MVHDAVHLGCTRRGDTRQRVRVVVVAVLHELQGVQRIPRVEILSARFCFTEHINVHHRHSIVAVRSLLALAVHDLAVAQVVQKQVVVHSSVG